ncbi:MAG: hypothetical protein WCF85_05000 [Rhodospirillaceae bacterium]
MANKDSAGTGKGPWPDTRSLRWPPEGIEAKSASKSKAETEPVVPFELAPAPDGSGVLVATPLLEVPNPEWSPPESTTAAAVVEEPPLPEPAPEPAIATDGSCQAAQILAELRSLRKAVEELTVTVKKLGDSGAKPANLPVPVPTRAPSDHMARQAIREYFLRHQGETIYPAQIAEALRLPILKVAELCENLAQRGQLSRDSAMTRP